MTDRDFELAKDAVSAFMKHGAKPSELHFILSLEAYEAADKISSVPHDKKRELFGIEYSVEDINHPFTLMYKESYKAVKDVNALNKYQTDALRTANTKKSDLLINGVLGLNGEAGEVADLIKKWKFQGHLIPKDDLIEELGDILWYVAITAEAIDVSLGEVAFRNIEKLKKRFPNGFSVERSVNRER